MTDISRAYNFGNSAKQHLCRLKLLKMNLDFKESPFLITWEVTRACSLICKNCRAEAYPHPHPEQLTTEESYNLIDQVKRANPVLFVMTGGDPTCRPDLSELIAYSASQGLRVGLSPSATPRLVRADFEQLHRVGVRRMSLGIDGPDEESHDSLRGAGGSWRWTMQALEKAGAACIPIQINTTITRENIGQFDKFVELMGEIEPMVWMFLFGSPMGECVAENLPSASEMEVFLNRVYKHAQVAPYDVKTTEGVHYRRIVSQCNAEAVEQRHVPMPLSMNDGNGLLHIADTGDVYPGGFLPIVAGNVRHGELGHIYRTSSPFRELRDPALLKGKCGQCEYNTICGGSRARAYAMTGDYLAEDELCAYQPVA